MRSNDYHNQVRLLLNVLPMTLADERFALKGGPVINLFVRDMPRLSIDIDLTYLPIEDRETSLNHIDEIMNQKAQNIERLDGVQVYKRTMAGSKITYKLTVEKSGSADIKIEPNLILRGSIYPCVETDLSQKAQDEFEMEVTARTLSLPDLYGGKICAALDCQHP